MCWFVMLMATHILDAQTGCPGCITTLPDLPEDTIFLSVAPDGQAGMYYEQDISFRMPQTTTPVAANDSTVPPGIVIQQVTIASVTNLPPGLQWQVSQQVFNPAEQTDGCVKLCGTPLFPGLYLVEVVVNAQVFFITQSSSFTFPLYIAPSQTITEGFSMTNNAGCGSVTASFENLIPSNGLPGFSYLWDFGNGNASLNENPGPQTYSSPGVYPVNYRAIVDTTGYFLTRVNVLEVGCTDFFGGAPDLKIGIYDGAGQEIYLSNVVDNAAVPLAFDFVLPLEAGNYSLRVTDEDGGIDGANDICGVVNFNKNTSGVLLDQEMSLELTILHPVDTVVSSDTVRVFAQPELPVIDFSSPAPYCEGDSLTIYSSYAEGIIWYKDSVPMLEITDPFYDITAGGDYWVVYTSFDGCTATSEVQSIVFHPYPQAVFTVANNLLSVYQPEVLPASYDIEWYFNGAVIPGEQELAYCIAESGEYALRITDLNTGCSSYYDQMVNYNPAFPNCTTDATDLNTTQWRVYPNPVFDHIYIQGWKQAATELRIQLINGAGTVVKNNVFSQTAGEIAIRLPLNDLIPGFYCLNISDGVHSQIVKLVRK